MNQIIVMNPFARHLRKDKTLRSRLLALVHRKTAIIETQTVQALIETLEQLSVTHTSLKNVAVYIIGGDGTFNQVLNWVMTLPQENRPLLMPVGGGQFNFMTKFVGLKSTDPSVNLAEIFSGRIHTETKSWRPVCVTDSYTHEKRYGAVIGNGILCDFVEWYEEMGKGDLLDVLKLIGIVISDFGKNMLRGRHGRIKPIQGTLFVDGVKLPCTEYAAIMAATVPEFMPTCKPFRAPTVPNAFSTYAYWGNFTPLALSVPFIWRGLKSPLTDPCAVNTNAQEIRIHTTDPRLLIDGDIHLWQSKKQPHARTLTFTHGPEIQLLHAVV
ncbi:hypothetical protein A2318_03315 [Candidatus Uhrbacteria bacterium RIFOXYB2_FULL_45_11]|uniref:DAGKc domain-containing protein n=1 Tax=Candidatus Uhrbacteria bacterium RIFOXYB2_FULL_45_11 TaxID=1802421 RepID=A0A1F7W4V6_9BACT|nr:MAG: hypothetical protein A2318_03315 [Candidatus Uhrbacteria bacterium RIFOXYB2_FULL_45_11]